MLAALSFDRWASRAGAPQRPVRVIQGVAGVVSADIDVLSSAARRMTAAQSRTGRTSTASPTGRLRPSSRTSASSPPPSPRPGTRVRPAELATVDAARRDVAHQAAEGRHEPAATPDRTLYELLPAVYREQDAEHGFPLRALLRIVADQVDVVDRTSRGSGTTSSSRRADRG